MKMIRRKNKGAIVRVLVLVMAMAMTLLAGCSFGGHAGGNGGAGDGDGASGNQKGDGGTKLGTGRFFEEELSLPKGIDGIMALRKLSDGSIGAVGESEDGWHYYILKSSNLGEKWEKKEIMGAGGEYIPQAAIAPDGKAALIHYAKDGKVNVDLAGGGGKATSISFSFPKGKIKGMENHAVRAAYDSAGNLIILDSEGTLFSVDADGTCSKAFDTKGVSVRYFGMVGTILTAVCDEGILLFDTQERKMLDAESVLDDLVKKDGGLASLDTDAGQPVVFAEGTKADGIMFVKQDGIFHFTRGGSVIEQVVDGQTTSFGSGDTVLQGLAAPDENNFFVAVHTSKGDKVFRYSYDKGAASVPDRELTVYALDDSEFLRQVVAMFQKKNPDIHVELEIGLSEGDGVTLEDAISVLNTDILAKKGPDVLILDGLPVESYIGKGVLAEISDVVEDVDKRDGIFDGIREGSKRDGKIYAMPARFLLSVVEGDRQTVEAGGNLAALAERVAELKKKKPSANVFPNKGTRRLLRDLYYADSARWQKEDGSLDRELLMEFMTCAKRLYDVDSGSRGKDDPDTLVGDGTLEGSKLGTNQEAGMISGENQMTFGSIASIYELQTMCSTWVQTKADYCLMNHEKVKAYIPYLLAGVTEAGNTDAAREFVRMLLGEEAGSSEHNGIPVNRAAFDKVCREKMDARNVKDESSVAFSGPEDGKVYGFEYINLTQDDIDTFAGIVGSLTEPSMTNRVIQEFVLEQGEKCLRGELAPEEAVDAILKKVNLYSAE